jgi:hypothetical protein
MQHNDNSVSYFREVYQNKQKKYAADKKLIDESIGSIKTTVNQLNTIIGTLNTKYDSKLEPIVFELSSENFSKEQLDRYIELINMRYNEIAKIKEEITTFLKQALNIKEEKLVSTPAPVIPEIEIDFTNMVAATELESETQNPQIFRVINKG